MRTRLLGRTVAAVLLVSVGLLSMAPDHGAAAPGRNGGADLIAGTTNVAYLGPTIDLPGALGNAAGSVGTVWRFEAFAAAGSTPWQLWSAALPASLQGFTQLRYGEAYFAVSSAGLRWEFAAGEVPDTPPSVQLGANGNNVVYFGETLPVETAVAEVVDGEASSAAVGVSQTGSITSIWSLEAGVWSLWSDALPAALQGISELVFGRPYFVTASAALEWVFSSSVTPPEEEPTPEVSPLVAELRELVGPLLSEEEIVAVIAGLAVPSTLQFFDRLPALDDPSLEIAQAGTFEFTFDAATLAAFLDFIGGGLAAGQVEVAQGAGPGQPGGPPGTPVQPGGYLGTFIYLGEAPGADDGIERQIGVGISLVNGPNTTPDPNGLGFGHLGLNWAAFLAGLPGWAALTALNPLNQFSIVPTDGFGYAGSGRRMAVVFLPNGEIPDPPGRIVQAVIFGRKTDGQPANDQQAAVTNTAVVEHPFDLPPMSDGDLIVPPTRDIDVLLNGRFALTMDWEDRDGTRRPAEGGVVEGLGDGVFAGDTGLFWFSDPDNWELLVKVLDGCAFNGHYWVFASGPTDPVWQLTIEDTETGEIWSGSNPLGQRSPAIIDTTAFATCP